MSARRSLAASLLVMACAPAPAAPDGAADHDAGADARGELDGGSPTPDGGSVGDALDAAADPPLRVLFIGNSYTSYNDLPSLVRQASATIEGAPPLEVETVLVDGATLWQHWTTTGARDRLHDGDFDVVVLQAQSTEPIRDAVDGSTGFGFAVRAFKEEANAVGARTVWFATWAREPGHADYERLRLGTPDDMTARIERAFFSHFGGEVTARVGAAFRIAMDELPAVDLYADDGSHPSAAGSLLASCVIAQHVSGVAPRAPAAAALGVGRDVADALCAIAPRVACFEGSAFCDGGCHTLARDPLHCGACGAECAGDLPCIGGVCRCEYDGWSACPGRYCANLELDEGNCGSCRNRCDTGQTCRAGSCECDAAALLMPSFDTLSAIDASCVRGDSWHPGCFAAVHAYCASLTCFDSGFGPLTAFPMMPFGFVGCVPGDVSRVTFAALAGLVPECSDRAQATLPACASAIHRSCVARGAITGFGPTALDDLGMQVTCLGTATLVSTTYAELGARFADCDGVSERGGARCAFASRLLCHELGHTGGGYGPVEASGPDVQIVCIDG